MNYPIKNSLIEKYNVPGPRYTSYPTVPYWEEASINTPIWKNSATVSFNESNVKEGISLYIHLPYCESLCTFCGCNKRITKNHRVEVPYIQSLLQEWDLYLQLFKEKPIIKEIHLGGGTPTFFKPENLKSLIDNLFKRAKRHPEWEFSFEGHPNNTSQIHLQTLYDIGFRRVSFGVQDYDIEIQKVIHRNQPFDQVAKVHHWAKEIGYTSIGHDLVFGLPKQTEDTIAQTIEKTNLLKPDRIAFYSYAHVPWIKGNGQRGFDENDLPKDKEKRKLYEKGKTLLSEAGYVEIGMDHFALPSDSLFSATQHKTLHRNFMGYTHAKTQLMIGLGVSAISDSWYCFAQNHKTIEEYQTALSNNQLPIFRGHLLNEEDLVIRKHVLNIMCSLQTSWTTAELQFSDLPQTLEKLQELEQDGILTINQQQLQVKPEGIPFIRNICMAFDWRMLRNKPQTQLFSMTI